MRHFAIATAFCLLPAPAPAQSIVTVTGQCEKLVAMKKDFAPFCRSTLFNTTHEQGRIGFGFLVSKTAVLTFSGTDMQNPTPDTDRMQVDAILFADKATGRRPSKIVVTGRCDYGNPYKGKMVVDCNASARDGMRFSARFVTDGKPPQ